MFPKKNKVRSVGPGHQNVPGFDLLLQPEILAIDNLVQQLQGMRLLQAEIDIKSLNKTELLELYYDLILPLPQRKYRENRRGRLLTQQQKSIDKSCGRHKLSEENHMLENAQKLKDGRLGMTEVFTPLNRLKSPLTQPHRIGGLNSKKKVNTTSLEDIIIQNKPRKNDEFCLPKKRKKVTLAQLTEPKTPLENVLIKTRKSTQTPSSDPSQDSSSCKLAAKIIRLKSLPPKRRCSVDPLDSIVIKKFKKNPSIDLDKNSLGKNHSSIDENNTQSLLLSSTDSASGQSPSSSSNTEESSVEVSQKKTVKTNSARPSDSSPSVSTSSTKKKPVKLKRPTTV